MAPWTDGDIICVVCAVVYLALGLAIQPTYRSKGGVIELAGTGLSLATLLLVLSEDSPA